jgi:hypothetical protein
MRDLLESIKSFEITVTGGFAMATLLWFCHYIFIVLNAVYNLIKSSINE